MDGIYQAWQTGLLWVCLCALGAMAAWLFLAKVAAPAWDAVRRWWSLPCIQRVIVGVCIVGLSYYGATKQGWHVAYDGGIKAGATANVVTNDTVAIYWQRDTSGGVYVPETATVYIDYRPNTATNEEWGLLAQTTVGAWGWSGTVENATNYDYNVWAYYIPPEPVHTNGVWTYKTHFDRNGEYALPLRARVEVNGVAIATPAEKRKDAEKRPYDAEVEYLESTGTQWIDTGVEPAQELAFSCSFAFEGIAQEHGYGNIFGSRLAATRREYQLTGYNSGIVSVGSRNPGLGFYHGVINTVSFDGVHTVNINGVSRSITTSTCSPTTGSIVLFGIRQDGTVFQLSKSKICSLKFILNGVLVRDYIPVRVGTTGALYDKRGVGGMNSDGTARNDGLYFNRGTGNFVYGNGK